MNTPHSPDDARLAGDIVTLDVADLARLLHKSIVTVRSDMCRRPANLPPGIRVGKKTVWLKDTVLRWLREREMPIATPMVVCRSHRGRPTKAEQVARRAHAK